MIGQLIGDGVKLLNWGEDQTAAATSAAMIFLGALLTGLNVYDNIAKVGRRRHHCPHHWICQLHCLTGHGVQVRGAGPRGRGKDVLHRGTGLGLRHLCQRGLRSDPLDHQSFLDVYQKRHAACRHAFFGLKIGTFYKNIVCAMRLKL